MVPPLPLLPRALPGRRRSSPARRGAVPARRRGPAAGGAAQRERARRPGPNPRIVLPVIALLVIAVVVIAIVVAGGSSRTPLTPQQLIADATPSVVRVQGAQGAGSGIVIDAKRQLVLTNAHVIIGNSALMGQIGNNATPTSPLQVVAADPCDDLAVLRLLTPIPRLKALTFGSSTSLNPGDSVTVLGFPGSFQQSLSSDKITGQATSVVANTGTVSQAGVKATPDPSLPTYHNTIVHQAPVNHGDSGGPLLNNKGQVVGVNMLTDTSNQGQYYAISSDYVKAPAAGARKAARAATTSVGPLGRQSSDPESGVGTARALPEPPRIRAPGADLRDEPGRGAPKAERQRHVRRWRSAGIAGRHGEHRRVPDHEHEPATR